MTETPVSALTDLEAAAELAFLAKRMAELDKAYYQADDPLVSDAEYDALKRRNEAIEARFPHLVRADSPSKKVGAKASEDFAKVTHSVPMLSLGNIFSTDEIFEFSNRIRRFLGLDDDAELAFMAEPKLDGLSFSALYVNGEFVEQNFEMTPNETNFGPFTVPEGHYFVMGDNRNNSKDSRSPMVGALERKMIKGHVRCVVFPLNKARILSE